MFFLLAVFHNPFETYANRQKESFPTVAFSGVVFFGGGGGDSK